MISVGWALQHARTYYDEETYEHALRVAGYVSEMWLIPEEDLDTCIALAIMHDLAEDTNFSIETDIPAKEVDFKKSLHLLTRDEGIPYLEYCEKLKENTYTKYGREAYWVKLADMKDHLSQEETLTDKLKAKYLKGMAVLL